MVSRMSLLRTASSAALSLLGAFSVTFELRWGMLFSALEILGLNYVSVTPGEANFLSGLCSDDSVTSSFRQGHLEPP